MVLATNKALFPGAERLYNLGNATETKIAQAYTISHVLWGLCKARLGTGGPGKILADELLRQVFTYKYVYLEIPEELETRVTCV